ncbi:GXWXG protein-domain-containing protein [Aspergillus filifer]
MASASEQYLSLINKDKNPKVNASTMSALFDQLPPVRPSALIGSWSGGFFDTGHSVGDKLIEIKWVGKEFESADEVDPVVVEREGQRASWGQWGRASVREMVYRGVLSATMIYDDRPVFDHFRYVNDQPGFAVTGTVRSQAKADEVLKTHPEWKGKVRFMIVPDFTFQKPFNALFAETASNPFTYVIHTEIQRSAHRHGGSTLKRFVLLDSAVSVFNSFEDPSREGRPYNEKDWNPVTAEQAIQRNDPILGYNVSKTQAEHKAWEFMKAHNPRFDLAVINPDIITGPMGMGSINETNHFAIASFIDRTNPKVEDVRFSNRKPFSRRAARTRGYRMR